MRVVVVGGSGNIGTSLLRALESDERVSSVVSVARRPASLPIAKVEWATADVAEDDLAPLFRDADAVVHLAFLSQPMRDEEAMRRTNVEGSRRLFDATAAAGVAALVFASTVGAYAPAPKSRRVDESWPLGPSGTSPYARHNVEVERLLDAFEAAQPEVRVVRLRLAVTWKREGATQTRRIYGGPFVLERLLRARAVPVVPDLPKLRFQCVHSDDAAEAIRLALTGDARGAFNVAADPPLDPRTLADILGARLVPAPPGAAGALRAGLSALWRLRAQPLSPTWLDMVLELPVLDCSRAREELGWTPVRTPREVVLELLEGLRDGADLDTPPLARETSGPARVHEVATGVGSREP